MRPSSSRHEHLILPPRTGDSAEPPVGAAGTPLLVLTCGRCERRFLICSRCFRGHRYCSRICSEAARRASVRRARRNHLANTDARDRRTERRKLTYRERKFYRPDHTSIQSSKRPKVPPARTTANAAGSTSRAEDSHVDRPTRSAGSRDVRHALAHDEAIERGNRCTYCGQLGVPVIHNRRRFVR
jgi:hypothetical protein